MLQRIRPERRSVERSSGTTNMRRSGHILSSRWRLDHCPRVPPRTFLQQAHTGDIITGPWMSVRVHQSSWSYGAPPQRIFVCGSRFITSRLNSASLSARQRRLSPSSIPAKDVLHTTERSHHYSRKVSANELSVNSLEEVASSLTIHIVGRGIPCPVKPDWPQR